MSIIVSKFGGSSTSCAEMFYRLRSIIAPHPQRRYIILSAPGVSEKNSEKITNLLYQCYKINTEGGSIVIPLEKIKRRFSEISTEIGLTDMAPFAEAEIRKGLAVSADHTASRGEYLCALLFSRWTGIPMVDAADIIHFKNDGKLDTEKTRLSIAKMKTRYPRAIIPGFYGSLPDGSVHTFPRNGSDITGALIAAGINADLYENWSDVDGFMSADPSIVEKPMFNPMVNYRQMHILACEGAQILHPDCLCPVAEKGIPTLLKNTLDPNGPGTLISDDCRANVLCVTGRDDYLFCRTDNPEFSTLPDNIPMRCLSDNKGHEYVLLRSTEYANAPGFLSPTACISIFGISQECAQRIKNTILPILSFDAQEHLKILVPPCRFKDDVQRVHDIVFDESTLPLTRKSGSPE